MALCSFGVLTLSIICGCKDMADAEWRRTGRVLGRTKLGKLRDMVVELCKSPPPPPPPWWWWSWSSLSFLFCLLQLLQLLLFHSYSPYNHSNMASQPTAPLASFVACPCPPWLPSQRHRAGYGPQKKPHIKAQPACARKRPPAVGVGVVGVAAVEAVAAAAAVVARVRGLLVGGRINASMLRALRVRADILCHARINM